MVFTFGVGESGFGGLVGLGAEVLEHLLGHAGAQQGAGVVGVPALVLVVGGQHAPGHGPARQEQDAGVGARVVDRAGLVGQLDLGRQEARHLLLVVALLEVLEHGLGGLGGAGLAVVEFFEDGY